MKKNNYKLTSLMLSGVVAGIIFACDAQIVQASVEDEAHFSTELTQGHTQEGKIIGTQTTTDTQGNVTTEPIRSTTELEYTTDRTTDELRQLDLDTLDSQVLGANLDTTAAEDKPSYKINTAADKTYMTDSEKDVVLYSNYARMYPKNYASNYLTTEFETYYVNQQDEQGKVRDDQAVREARQVLNTMEPQEALYTFEEYKNANKPYAEYVGNVRKSGDTYYAHVRPGYKDADGKEVDSTYDSTNDKNAEGLSGQIILNKDNKDTDGSPFASVGENLAYGVYSSKSEKANTRTDGFYAVLNWIIDYGETKSLKPGIQMDRGHRRVLLGENDEKGQPIKFNRIAVNQIENAGRIAGYSSDPADKLNEANLPTSTGTDSNGNQIEMYPSARETITTAQYAYSDLPASTTYEAPTTNQVETTETKAEEIAYTTKRQLNKDMLASDAEKVVRKGVNGQKEVTYKVVTENGQEISRKKISEKVTKEAVEEIIEYGNKVVTTEDVTTDIPYTPETRENADLAQGEEKVVQAGVNGVLTTTYEIVTREGVEESRTEVKSVVTKNPVNEIKEIGTKVVDQGGSQSGSGSQAGDTTGQGTDQGQTKPQTGGDQQGQGDVQPGSQTPEQGTGSQAGGTTGQGTDQGQTAQTGDDQAGGAAGQEPGSGQSTPQTGGDRQGQTGSQTSGSDSKVQPETTSETKTPESKQPDQAQKEDTSADKGVQSNDKVVISSTEDLTSQVKTYQAVGDSFNEGNEVNSATAKFLDEKPENVVTMEVAPKVDSDTNREFDITFKDSNGDVVSVNGRVLVTLPTGGRTVDYVYHMVDGVAEKIDHVQDVKEYVEFVADDFSVYGMKFINASQTQTSETKAQAKATSQTKTTSQAKTSSQEKTTSKDSESSSEQLPETGEAGLLSVFNQSALSILAGLGLIAPRRKEG